VKCKSPLPPGSSFGIDGKVGSPSNAIFNLPEEPLILKFLTLSTKSG
jgi:hypothetical protein